MLRSGLCPFAGFAEFNKFERFDRFEGVYEASETRGGLRCCGRTCGFRREKAADRWRALMPGGAAGDRILSVAAPTCIDLRA